MSSQTDLERTLAALRKTGSRGITVRDFDPPKDGHVIDGGGEFTRLHARVCDLRKQGYQITTVRAKPFCRYVLTGYAPVERGVDVQEAQATAFSLSFEVETVGGGTPVTLRVLHPGWHLTDDGRYVQAQANEEAA